MVREEGRKGTDKVDAGMLRTVSSYRMVFRLRLTFVAREDLLLSSRMVRSGIPKVPGPPPAPLAASPVVGALEKRPGRVPSGSGPFSRSAGRRPAIATSTLALPAIGVAAAGACDGDGGEPMESAGAPSPSGKLDLMVEEPAIEVLVGGVTSARAETGERACRVSEGGGTKAFRGSRARIGFFKEPTIEVSSGGVSSIQTGAGKRACWVAGGGGTKALRGLTTGGLSMGLSGAWFKSPFGSGGELFC